MVTAKYGNRSSSTFWLQQWQCGKQDLQVVARHKQIRLPEQLERRAICILRCQKSAEIRVGESMALRPSA
jgi:hypothetical protein